MNIIQPQIRQTKRTRKTEPNALCSKVPAGIVVAKPPQPKPLPIIASPVRTQERFAPLSQITVPAIRGHFTHKPFEAMPKQLKRKHRAIVAPLRPKKPRGPAPRIVTDEEQSQREPALQPLLTNILKILQYTGKKSKLQIAYKFPRGSITRIAAALALGIKRGLISKEKSRKPSFYLLTVAPIVPATQVASEGWITGPNALIVGTSTVEPGWTTQL